MSTDYVVMMINQLNLIIHTTLNITQSTKTPMYLPKRVILVFLSTLVSIVLLAQKKNYYDGPYIFETQDSLLIQWVAAGVGSDTTILKSTATQFNVDSLPKIDLQQLRSSQTKQATYEGVDEIFAVSDIHGQHDLFLRLLKANEIIDENQNWTFDKGHLVIVGDNFDRGEKVLDLLWFLFKLQQQAETAGGKVHVMLGNHEVMVLNNDLRYLHKKYYYSSASFTTRYDQFFRSGSILGDWLSSHPVVLSINGNLFVHGGISTAVLGLEQSLEEINETFVEHLIRKDRNEIDSKFDILTQGDGPLWYRGYFDSLATNQSGLEQILEALDQSAIVVGHTSMDKITSLYEGKLIAIDCSIKLGLKAQGLSIKNRKYHVTDTNGKKTRIQGPEDTAKASLFNYLYNLPERTMVTIETDIKTLVRKSNKEEYQTASLSITRADDSVMRLEGRARARGNVRKKVCKFPPVKFDFSKSYLDSLGFVKNDKLKLVFPCTSQSYAQNKLYKEFFLYQLYNIIDTNSLTAKLLDISIVYEGEERNQFTGFLVEDEEEYMHRKNARVIETGRINVKLLERSSFLKMLFFQYMICNTDWAVSSRHNMELVKLKNIERVIALPYDFDYSGYVGQHYATPHSSLPIKEVSERYFMPYKISEAEFDVMIDYYLSIEDDVYAALDRADYLGKKEQKQSKSYFEDFFDLLRYPNRIKDNIINRY